MIITRRPDIEAFMLDEIRAYFVKQNEKRTGIHLSDLLKPRQAYWQRVKPLPPTNEEIQYFLIGRGHEESLHACSGYEHGEEQEWEGILYTPDFYHNFPDESKTRRGNLAAPGEEEEKYKYYLDQVRGYCAVTGRPQAWLRVWSLMEKQEDYSTKPELAAYQVEFTEVELIFECDRLKTLKAAFLEALRQNNHKLLSQCPSWMCGKVSRTVKTLAHCEDCNKDFLYPERHKKSKPHHTVSSVEYNFSFEKRCKWFEDCQPDLSQSPA